MLSKMCIAAANYIIERTNEYNTQNQYDKRVSLTCKRLQKILYFSEVQYMKQNDGQAMFSDEFYAWPSGPVIPSVYYQFMKYQNGEMLPNETQSSITKEMSDAIDHILENTWDRDTIDLVKDSHVPGGPWSQAYDGTDPEHKQTISKHKIYNYYKNREMFFPT